jgi:hypothetical protein
MLPKSFSKKLVRRFQQIKNPCSAFRYTSRVPMKTPGISRRKFIGAASAAVTLTAIPASLRAAAREPGTPEASSTASTVRISSAANPILLDPDQALGSSMDILSHDVVEKIYTPEMVKQCLSAGWGPITYRQNTELSIGAWHWNPNGTWSDPAHKRGYFTGSAELKDPIRHSYGYPLPHRGHAQWRRRARLLAPDRWESQFLLEEQSLPRCTIHRPAGFGASAMGGDRSRRARIDLRHTDRLGRVLRA